jgi:F-type H+-transporting ATPase subunit delta
MNGRRTIARPYAKAIFELACEDKQLGFWSETLSFLSIIAKDRDLQAVYHDVRYTASELSQIFISLCQKAKIINPLIENLVLLLAHYKRLLLLPMISMLYEEYKASLEKTINISVTSAFPLSEKISANLKKALEIRLQRDVEINFAQDRTLIGGAVIRVGDGDLVIDGSVRNKLEQLKQTVVD